jgi:cytochrome c oxidase subunit 3
MPGTVKPLVGNAQLAMIIFIAAELMFFSGIIGAFLVFRFSGKPWPPPFQPRLPVGITAVNTVFLLISSFTFMRAKRDIRLGDGRHLCTYLTVTAALGVLFLAIQGYEWVKLLNFGLTVSSGTYASTFYTIIGTHALHVSLGVIWLLAVLVRAWLGYYSPDNYTGVTTCGMYWHLVVGLWPALFYLVYLL